MMDHSAIWAAAIGAVATAITTFTSGLFAYLSLLAKNRQQDAEIAKLQEAHVDCVKERQELTDQVAMEWPSDVEPVLNTLAILKEQGVQLTIRHVLMVMEGIRKKQAGSPIIPFTRPPEGGSV